MVTHDPMCPGCVASDGLCDSNCAACLCELIARVRVDERNKSASRLISYIWESGMASYTYSGDMDDMVKAITMKEEDNG